MRKLIRVLIPTIAGAIMVTGAIAQQATPTVGDGQGQPSANASPIGIERATRNSDGGDRQHGAFGQAQSDYVKTVQPYGRWLQDNGWTGSSK